MSIKTLNESAQIAFTLLCDRIVDKLPPSRKWEFTCSIVNGIAQTNRPELRTELQALWDRIRPTDQDIARDAKFEASWKAIAKAHRQSMDDIAAAVFTGEKP